MIWTDFCLGFVVEVCSGGLVAAEKSSDAFLNILKLEMISTILVLLNTGIFVNRDGILFYLEPFVRVCFRVVRGAIS